MLFIMCSWGGGVCVARRYFFPMIAHVLGVSELEELCDLCIRSLWGFPKVVRQFVVNFLIGGPLFCICEFHGCFSCEPIVLCLYEWL